MLDASDYELQKEEPPPTAPSRSPLWWVAGAVVIGVAAGVVWFYLGMRQPPPSAAPSPVDIAAPEAPPRPLGGPGDAIELPPLAETDAVVRPLVRALSSHPLVAAWLTTDGLIRGFTVAVDNIASGVTPAPRLSVLRPSGRFAVIDGDDDLLLDPRGYARYAPLAAAVDALNADAVARLYSTLKPRIEDAYAELGRQQSFDATLQEAIVALLAVPALDANVRLVPKGAVYAFEDPRLERLTPAQKQLARMGPRNARVIQNKLRQIAVALGIPPERVFQ